MPVPISVDPTVLERIYRRFSYLKDQPLILLGSYIDQAASLGHLETNGFLGFLMAYPVTDERPRPDRYRFLSQQDNLALRYYRHIRPVEPWPQPLIGVVFDPKTGEGRTTGEAYSVDVTLRPAGNAQLWWGGKTAVIWEAFFEPRVRVLSGHELLMHKLWDRLERYLVDEGVRDFYTLDRDPALDRAWYCGFLRDRGYIYDQKCKVMIKAFAGSARQIN